MRALYKGLPLVAAVLMADYFLCADQHSKIHPRYVDNIAYRLVTGKTLWNVLSLTAIHTIYYWATCSIPWGLPLFRLYKVISCTNNSFTRLASNCHVPLFFNEIWISCLYYIVTHTIHTFIWHIDWKRGYRNRICRCVYSILQAWLKKLWPHPRFSWE